MKHVNWDNLRYVLMVANKGSISSAARELGVNRSTVLRRIERFQEDLSCRIFNRNYDGYALTPEAEKMIDAARAVESTLYDMQRQVVGQELRLEGELRVTTTDTLMNGLLTKPLARFQKQHPRIVLNLLVTNSVLDLSRRDADVAVRPAEVPDAGFKARKLCDVGFTVYQSLSLSPVVDWKTANWIGVAGKLSVSGVGTWIDNTIDPSYVVIRCDSLVTARICAEAGMGIALLPTVLGDASPSLTRVEGTQIEYATGLWLLTHPDLVQSARVNAFIEHMSDEFKELRTS